jgi:hypothetical protein
MNDTQTQPAAHFTGVAPDPAVAERLDELQDRFEAAASRLWDARLRYMLLESDQGRKHPAVVEAWRRYQELRNQCSALLAEIDGLDVED